MDNSIVFDSAQSESFTSWRKQWSSNYEANPDVVDTIDFTQPFQYITRRTGQSQYATNNIRHHITMPEYPESSNDGVLHIIDVKGRPRKEVEQMHEDIQFGKRKLNHRDVKSDLLNDATVHLTRFECSGIKICSFLHPQLRQFTNYTKVDNTWFSLLETTRQEPVVDPALREQNSEKYRLTEGLYLTLQKNYFENRPCRPYGKCTGKPVLRSSTNLLTGAPQYNVGCSKYRSNDGIYHHWNDFKASYVFDAQYLQTLFISREKRAIRYCSTIEKMKASRNTCMEIHVQSATSYQKISCHVEIAFIVPQDLNLYPWVFLWVKGLHTHPPPPPTKTPQRIFKEVTTLMKAHNLLTLTRAKPGFLLQAGEFLRSPQMAKYLENNNVSFVSNIHPSLNNDDLWRYHIRVLRLTQYPQGTDFVGVVYEYNQQHIHKNVYIQEIIDDSDGDQLVCCFTHEQAVEFMRLKFIQVDMTFKRIYGKINEIVFGYFNDNGQKSFTVARIYVNRDTEKIYEKAFGMLFRNLSKVTGQLIQFEHIHNSGFQGFLADMCGKQAHGLGAYLHSLDSQRTWQQHISHVLIYCLVHFERNIRIFQSYPLYYDIKAIPKLESREEIQLLFNRLKTDPDKKVRDFARRYNCQLILGGLNKHYSSMNSEFFTVVQHHTNTLESIHRKTNQMGIHQSWLAALKSAQNIDTREIHSVTTWFFSGVKHSWSNKSPSKRLLNAIKKRDRHIRKLDNKTRAQPVILISSDEDSDTGENPSSSQLVNDRLSTAFSHTSTPKRSRSPSLLQLGEAQWREQSLSRTRLVTDWFGSSRTQEVLTKEERRKQRQLLIDEMQAELDQQNLDSE